MTACWKCKPGFNPISKYHVRFTWTSFDDRANPTITEKHIHRWQLANSFCSSACHTPLTVYHVLTKTSISAGVLSPVNIVARRVETDNNVLLQVHPIFWKLCLQKATLKVCSHLFASICLRTHPLLSCARNDTLFFFFLSKIIWVSKTHDG